MQIDATIFGDYYYRFSKERKKYLETVMLIGGLEADIRRAGIFKETFGTESLSPVNVFNLVNKKIIGNAKTVKITDSNKEEIDKLKIDDNINKFLTAKIEAGNIIYIPDKICIYKNWKGMWYISLDKNFMVDYGSIFF